MGNGHMPLMPHGATILTNLYSLNYLWYGPCCVEGVGMGQKCWDGSLGPNICPLQSFIILIFIFWNPPSIFLAISFSLNFSLSLSLSLSLALSLSFSLSHTHFFRPLINVNLYYIQDKEFSLLNFIGNAILPSFSCVRYLLWISEYVHCTHYYSFSYFVWKTNMIKISSIHASTNREYKIIKIK